jgi:predicted alpha/beta-hydrolase family hydrolase
MTSQAQALDPLPGVRGLAFLGFPLHPAGSPSSGRAQHLAAVRIPLLFVQGTGDALAQRELLDALMTRLGARASLRLIEHADHSFHVPARSGNDAAVRSALLRVVAGWMESLL